MSCVPNSVLEFHQEEQVSLSGLDFPRDGFGVSVHPPSEDCRQLGTLKLETIGRAALVHEVRVPGPWGAYGAGDSTYFTKTNDFYPTALKKSVWLTDVPKVQHSLDSLVGAAKSMGGNFIADLEFDKSVYQLLWDKNGSHLVIRDESIFLPIRNDRRFVPVIEMRGLVCRCDSL